MKFIVFVHGNEATESGTMPTQEQLAEMASFNERLVQAGKMLGGEGLHPTTNALLVSYDGEQPAVTRGPFDNGGRTVAGYWLLEGDSMDEIRDWLVQAPFEDGSVEIRQIFGDDDFGDAMTPELKEREAKMREAVEGQAAQRT